MDAAAERSVPFFDSGSVLTNTYDAAGNLTGATDAYGGNTPPGLNRREKEKPEKPDNPNKPEKPDNPGTHIYTYDELNRMVTSDISKVKSTYTSF